MHLYHTLSESIQQETERIKEHRQGLTTKIKYKGVSKVAKGMRYHNSNAWTKGNISSQNKVILMSKHCLFASEEDRTFDYM